jgi:hypothetical protein
MPPRKDRSDAWWNKSLSQEDQLRVYEVLQQRGLVEGQRWVAREFKLEPPPSVTAMGRFFRAISPKLSVWRIEKALSNKTAVEKLVKNVGDVEDLTIQAISHLAFDASLSRDPAAIRTLVGALTDLLRAKRERKSLSLDERKLVLLEKRAALADKAENIAKASLSPAEKERAMKTIFGLAS